MCCFVKQEGLSDTICSVYAGIITRLGFNQSLKATCRYISTFDVQECCFSYHSSVITIYAIPVRLLDSSSLLLLLFSSNRSLYLLSYDTNTHIHSAHPVHAEILTVQSVLNTLYRYLSTRHLFLKQPPSTKIQQTLSTIVIMLC